MAAFARKTMRRALVAVAGLAVLALGLAMVVLPGPAVLVIPVGLGILATEFAWARLLVKRLKRAVGRHRK